MKSLKHWRETLWKQYVMVFYKYTSIQLKFLIFPVHWYKYKILASKIFWHNLRLQQPLYISLRQLNFDLNVFHTTSRRQNLIILNWDTLIHIYIFIWHLVLNSIFSFCISPSLKGTCFFPNTGRSLRTYLWHWNCCLI